MSLAEKIVSAWCPQKVGRASFNRATHGYRNRFWNAVQPMVLGGVLAGIAVVMM